MYRGPITGVYDEATRQAVEDLIGIENLEDRWPFGSDQIDPVAFKFLQKKYPAPQRRIEISRVLKKPRPARFERAGRVSLKLADCRVGRYGEALESTK